jgi:hypothetical protein
MLLYPGARSTTTTRVAVEAILPRGIGEIKQLYAQSTNPNLVEVVDANGELYCCWGYTNNTYEYHFNGRMTSGTGGFEGRLRNEQIKKK